MRIPFSITQEQPAVLKRPEKTTPRHWNESCVRELLYNKIRFHGEYGP
ncbi:protein of unknown function [Maridesulfovibrio hydrothermalis AM13 = DSM 14728]|uniref:Uncharacterized protein n=1 Tax=Maridesulfovibrio hydrothermalis AM13 = DSM 14728 TaxID=1121451 RepID=L0RFP3_9BACT|nr:protein of unknown function [Maridesulfovibrio hydrothermalis AM13 = DSM 14728]